MVFSVTNVFSVGFTGWRSLAEIRERIRRALSKCLSELRSGPPAFELKSRNYCRSNVVIQFDEFNGFNPMNSIGWNQIQWISLSSSGLANYNRSSEQTVPHNDHNVHYEHVVITLSSLIALPPFALFRSLFFPLLIATGIRRTTSAWSRY